MCRSAPSVQMEISIVPAPISTNVGMLGLMAANKGVDPFLPEEGHVLTIPTQLILPDVPHKGIVINLAELRLYYFPKGEDIVHV